MKKLALLFVLIFIPLFVHASALVDLNTADEATLESLPGIGPTKATAIIAYRSANGAFASITDVQKVSGIGPSTFAEIEALISVDDSGVAASSSGASSTASVSGSSDQSPAAPSVIQNPIQIDDGGDRVVAAGADTAYTANVSDANGNADQDPQVRWAFGDGSVAVGASVMKSYALPGTYLVSISASANGESASDSFTVVAKDPQIKISAVSHDGITIENQDASDPLDLSYWQLSANASLFTFPAGTKITAGGRVTFPSAVTALPFSTDAALLYPSGASAATYAPDSVAPAQPPPAAASSQLVQVESASTSNDTAHAQESIAPATTSELAAAGAAIPRATRFHLISMLKSPYALGALGVLVFSAGAFMVL